MHEFPVGLKLSSQLCLFKWHCHCPLAIDPGCPPPHHQAIPGDDGTFAMSFARKAPLADAFGAWGTAVVICWDVFYIWKKCPEKAIWVWKNGFRCKFTKLISWISLRYITYVIYVHMQFGQIITTSPDVTPKRSVVQVVGILLHNPQFSLGMIPICPTHIFQHHICCI